jgi:hypothetical protein
VGVVELLQERLPDGVDIKTCEDFKHFNVECCDTCHNFLPESEMYLIDLPDGGGKAWVCDQVRWAIYPEEYKEFQERSRTQEELWKVLDYYPASFARDLDEVIGTHRPRYFGGTWRTGGCEGLRKVEENNRPAFVTCLYFFVLFDQGLYHHAHHAYKNTALCGQQPKFCSGPGRGHVNPRGILRYPLLSGLVSPEELMGLAAPAARLFVYECVDTVEKLMPQVSLPNFFHLFVNFPEVNFWSSRVTRRFPAETKVEQKFLGEMLSAIRECGF